MLPSDLHCPCWRVGWYSFPDGMWGMLLECRRRKGLYRSVSRRCGFGQFYGPCRMQFTAETTVHRACANQHARLVQPTRCVVGQRWNKTGSAGHSFLVSCNASKRVIIKQYKWNRIDTLTLANYVELMMTWSIQWIQNRPGNQSHEHLQLLFSMLSLRQKIYIHLPVYMRVDGCRWRNPESRKSGIEGRKGEEYVCRRQFSTDQCVSSNYDNCWINRSYFCYNTKVMSLLKYHNSRGSWEDDNDWETYKQQDINNVEYRSRTVDTGQSWSILPSWRVSCLDKPREPSVERGRSQS